MNSRKSSSFLTHMIVMIDPQQIKANEIAKVKKKNDFGNSVYPY